MKRIVVLGRGGAGKSTLARQLQQITGIPVVELDELFWGSGLVATPRDRWIAIQRDLTTGEAWILDGDLGPYDALEVRLQHADTVIVLDFSLMRCAWRSAMRSRERLDYWRWLVSYRWRYLPTIRRLIFTHAPTAQVHALRNPHQATEFLAHV